MQSHKDTQKQIDEMLNDSMRTLAKAHKSAIVKKLTERQDKKKEEMRLKREQEE